MLIEAQKWREGLRDDKGPRCRCAEHAKHGVACGPLGHIATPRHVCLWEYGVARIYELERQLGI
jgi:hypothetical protein